MLRRDEITLADLALSARQACTFSMGCCMREPYLPISTAVCNASIPQLPSPESSNVYMLGMFTYYIIYAYTYSYFNKVVHEQSGKVEYERERLLGIANKLMNFQRD